MIREYGGQVVIPDLEIKYLIDPKASIGDVNWRVYKAYAIGFLRGRHDDSVTWVLQHRNMSVRLQRNEPLRCMEVNIVTTYDDELEMPPTDRLIAVEGKRLMEI